MDLFDQVMELASTVKPIDEVAACTARIRHDSLVKPKGSLGRLEEIGIRLAAITGECPPKVPQNAAVLVAAGDHGVLAQGVSPWPQEVTASMVAGFCEGRAAVNALARVVGARVAVLDVGVACDLPGHPRLRRAKVCRGTADLVLGPAMGQAEVAAAVMAGAHLTEELIEAGVDLLVTGEMGIANTTPAACLIAAFTGCSPDEATGRGTGIDDATWEIKVKVVRDALHRHGPDPADPLGVLAALGGAEHAALVGSLLKGAAMRVPIILDGVSTNAAALVAVALVPAVRDYLIAGHRSVEPGATIALHSIGLDPLLDLSMRLGEGTGGLLAVPIVKAAAAALRDMATFEEAGMI